MKTTTRNVLALSAIIAATALGACSSGDADGVEVPAERAHNVRILELARTNLEESIVISGPLRPVRGTDIATQESGVIQSLPKDKGSVVKKGQIVVLLNRGLLAAELKSAEAARILREYNEERTRQLYDANSVSKQEMLRVHTELQQAGQAERIAQIRHERAAIKSPFDGVVVDRFVELGELVSPGMRVARVVDPYTLKLVGSVTEQEIALIREGAPAKVTLDGADVVIDGVVRYVGFEANPMNGKFTVEVEVDNADLALRAGVVGRARVQKAVHESVLAIPRDAIVRTQEGLRIYVVEGNRAVPRQIELGAAQGLMVQVTGGLQDGDQLVVRGQRQISPGGLVAIQERATARDGSIATDPPEVREEGAILEVPKELAGDSEALR